MRFVLHGRDQGLEQHRGQGSIKCKSSRRDQSQEIKKASRDRGHDRDFRRFWVKIKDSQQGRGYHVGHKVV
jgi:hypothetical protein